jgi:hypothetical protein
MGMYMKFVHAGAGAYRAEKFVPVQNGARKTRHSDWVSLKPYGGLWGTPEGNPEWDLLGEKEHKFTFGLKPDAKVLHIHQGRQLVEAIRRRPSWDHRESWVWLASRWDAVWVHEIDHLTAMTGWDIESIVVLNPNVIEA